MNSIWETIRLFIASHKAASIVTAGALGVAAVGAGGYGIYSTAADKDADQVVEVVEVAEQVAAEKDVYIPEIVNVVITSESIEKDLTIYISDENDNNITGVPFQVKMMTPEVAEELQQYVDAINDIDTQIVEYTKDYVDEEETEEESDADSEAQEESTEDSTSEESESVSADSLPSTSAKLLAILEDRNVDVTVTDENGDVIETQPGDISTDPLYLLYLDKETAIQAYAVALNEAEGTVYTDEDEDGIITETDLEPGDYVLCLINDIDSAVSYEPSTLETAANVKDKVEYKVQKEITKQVKEDVAAEDGQVEEATPVEEELKDTTNYVASSKVESGGSYKETTDVEAPKTTASASKATKKDGAVTSVSHDIVKTTKAIIKSKGAVSIIAKPNNLAAKLAGNIIKVATVDNTTEDTSTDETATEETTEETKEDTTEETTTEETTKATYTITIKYVDSDGKSIKDTVTESKEEGSSYSYSAPSISGYSLTSTSPVTGTVSGDATVTFTYKKNEVTKYTVTIKYVDASGNSIKDTATETKESGASYSYTAPEISGYTLTSTSPVTGTVSGDVTVTFKYKKNEVAKTTYTITIKYVDADGNSIKDTVTETKESGASYSYDAPEISGYTLTSATPVKGTVSQNTTIAFTYKKTETKTTETATLDMAYSAGTFTISASTNVGSVKVNGTEVTMKDGKGTFKITSDGDYKLTGVATFSDKATDSSLAVTYTVSGFGTSSTEKLKDSKGNQLYIDAEGKTEATAADYVLGQTYYYKDASYTYYGWQTVDGITRYYDENGNYVTGEQVIQHVKYNFGTDGGLISNGTGIDVSKHQGTIDWTQAGPAVSFAIVRCGYRGMYDGQLHEDSKFYTNMKGAKANGVTTGVYVYSTALNEAEAVAEASMAVSMVNKAGGCSLPIFIDMEDSTRGQSGLSNEQRTAIINAFCTTVQSAGYKAGVYANKNWMTNKINTGSLSGSCYIWVAQYNTSCTYSGKKSIWQYSSKGSIPGIKGNVDMNKSYF